MAKKKSKKTSSVSKNAQSQKKKGFVDWKKDKKIFNVDAHKTKSGKAAWDCPASVEGVSEHDRQFESNPHSPNFNPLRPEDAGQQASSTMTDDKRREKGIGTPCDFGSWAVPNRRLNPRNPEDAKIIKRGMDSIYTNQTNPSCAKGNINARKYNKNCEDIGLGKKKSAAQEKEDGFERNGNKLKKKYG